MKPNFRYVGRKIINHSFQAFWINNQPDEQKFYQCSLKWDKDEKKISKNQIERIKIHIVDSRECDRFNAEQLENWKHKK